MTEEEKEPRIKLSFIYNHCNDVETMRKFYTDLIGLKQHTFHNDEQWGYLCYKTGGLDLMFFRFDEKIPVQEQWAVQPGWEGGTFEGTSWSIEVPENLFPEVVKKLKVSNVKCFTEKPMWLQDSYWGFPVMDPMGNTVEVYTTPKEKPTSTEWQD